MVTFFEAVKLTFARRFNTNYRISRAEFWWMQIWVIAYALLTFGIALLAGYGLIDPYYYYSESAYIADVVFFAVLIWLVLLIPNIILNFLLAIRRLHDLNMTGWWSLLILSTWLSPLLYGACLVKGNVGPNRFGPDPYTPVAPAQDPVPAAPEQAAPQAAAPSAPADAAEKQQPQK